MTKEKGQKAKGKGRGGEATGNADVRGAATIDELYQLPLAEFTPARNALAAHLRKAGKSEEADEVRSLVKPSIPAWAVNQVYWKHRPAFDRLLESGDRLRTAQSSALAGKSGDIRGALDAVRESLSELSRLAAAELEQVGHNASAGVMRAITATLEALSAYGSGDNAPPAGRLVDEVDPPGFETLAALVPNAAGASSSDKPPRLLHFQHHAAAPKRAAVENREERRQEERRAKLAAAKAAVQDAENNLREARATAQDSQSALKKAAAHAKDTEEAMIKAEQVLDKAAKDAHAARQTARRLAAEAEAAAQAVEDAERTLARAKSEVEEI